MAGVVVILPLILLVSAGIVSAWLMLRRSVERERQARAAADRARQMKDQFVSMVSHELRTPLTSIAGFADTLIAGWQDLPASEVDEFLRIIAQQAHHLGELVEDVLVIPRLEAGRLVLATSEFDLSELAHEVVELLVSPVTATEVSVAIPAGVRALADRNRVHQILRNLVENALKYGGGQILVEGSEQDGMYQVSIDDNGPGIEVAERERVFEHFEQVTKGDNRSDEGVGLGLPIARRLARVMGGDLWFEERFPTGSRFCFTVPLAGPVEAAGTVASDPQPIDLEAGSKPA